MFNNIGGPRVWGPLKWREFHVRSYSPDINLSFEQFWIDKWEISIPCPTCRKHFQELRLKRPEDLSSIQAYRKWGIDIHNDVNRLVGNPIFTPN